MSKFVTTLLMVAFLTSADSRARGDDAKIVAAIRNAYEANRSELAFGEARFHVAEGVARSAEDVWKGRWETLWSTADGLLIFDGSRARFERVHPPAAIVANREKVGETSWSSPLTESIRAVTDGQNTLSDRIYVEDDGKTTIHAAQIDSGTANFCRYFLFPLDIGCSASLGPRMEVDLDASSKGRVEWKVAAVDGKAELRGRPVIKVTLKSGEIRASTGSTWRGERSPC